jgi:hypothetical protein
VCATIGTQHWIYNVTGTPPVSLYKEWTYEDAQYQKQQGELSVGSCAFFPYFITICAE